MLDDSSNRNITFFHGLLATSFCNYLCLQTTNEKMLITVQYKTDDCIKVYTVIGFHINASSFFYESCNKTAEIHLVLCPVQTTC